MTCFYCKSDMTESTSTYFAEIDGKILIIKNVPCLKCKQCGETAYTMKISRKIESIIEKFKSSLSEIEILNYNNVA